MQNLSVNFTYWWLLFLIIPAVALALIPYFRLSKKYRKTRNRITSIALHIAIMVLSISVLAGMSFSYQVANNSNEVIFLVDVSETSEQSNINRDQFLQTALRAGRHDGYKIGVVVFGFDQKYAVPLTANVDSIYQRYSDFKDMPDISATNIAAALNFTRELFSHPKTAKIVLVSDGKETDEEASRVIRSISASGIRVDTAYISTNYNGNDSQLIDVELPNYNVSVGAEFNVNAMLQTKGPITAVVDMYDNDVKVDNASVPVSITGAGTHAIQFTHVINDYDVHKLTFKLTTLANDLLEQNNQYTTYMRLNLFNKILILESIAGESTSLNTMLTADDAYDVTVKNVYTNDDIPTSVNALRNYHQIILNNISNFDLNKSTNSNMPEGFVDMLNSYVEDYGGGLLTLGGKKAGTDEANAYNRDDMNLTKYQSMLPVEAVDYTPPLGVVVIIDTSASMAAPYEGYSYLEWAKTGAYECLAALTERDYFGLMTLGSHSNEILKPTPRTQEALIRSKINGLQTATGGTVFPEAINKAGMALRALNVTRRHILIVTDGAVPSNQRQAYEDNIKHFYDTDGITLSIVGINMTVTPGYDINSPLDGPNGIGTADTLSDYLKMLRAAIIGNGRIYTSAPNNLATLMRNELTVDEIKEINDEAFAPTIASSTSPVTNGISRGTTDDTKNKMTVEIGGFYGTKLKENAELILAGEHSVPIYAQWKLGEGMVGSFMCDLNGGAWSYDLMNDENGVRLINNIIEALMPLNNIEPTPITATLTEYNYFNQLSIYSTLAEGQRIEGTVTDILSQEQASVSLNEVVSNQDSFCTVPVALTASNSYSRCSLVIKKAGVYKITLTIVNSDGSTIPGFELYKKFSYSKEYDTFMQDTDEELKTSLLNLALNGGGEAIKDLESPQEIYKGFDPRIDKTFDPKFLFITIAIVLFLLDIAVRKFKFKWPHELYREYKNNKAK